MNCFQHPQKIAVRHCTYCGRGLCQECLTLVDGKLSCRGSCREEIERERRLFAGSEMTLSQRSVIYETTSKVYQRAFSVSAAFGLVMLAASLLLALAQAWVVAIVLAVLGVAFLMHGIAMARAGKKFKAMAAEGRTEGMQS